MATDRRVVAATELVLILPATLFLSAVVARYLQTLPRETAPERPAVIHPPAALHAPTLIIAATTSAAGLILTIVALHMLAN